MSRLRVDPSATYSFVASVLLRPLMKSLKFRTKVKNASDSFTFFEELSSLFGKSTLAKSRNRILSSIFEHFCDQRVSYCVFEFGVAHGYLADYYLIRRRRRFRREMYFLKSWDGFDTFSGLPAAWRDRQTGEFSNFGIIPNINDSRVQFHKGLVQETFKAKLFLESRFSDCKSVFIFDLDLEEPTHYVYLEISSFLSEGDIVYFDQAFDPAERKILHILLNDFHVSLLGISLWGCALIIEKRK